MAEGCAEGFRKSDFNLPSLPRVQEYRGFVFKAPSFNLASLNTNSWTHTAQPSAGIVFRF